MTTLKEEMLPRSIPDPNRVRTIPGPGGPIVVTRHPALVELLRERYVLHDDIEVIVHVDHPARIWGRDVIGVLPLELAAEAASVTTIPLALTPEDRGKELDLPRLREIAGPATTYVVERRRYGREGTSLLGQEKGGAS